MCHLSGGVGDVVLMFVSLNFRESEKEREEWHNLKSDLGHCAGLGLIYSH